MDYLWMGAAFQDNAFYFGAAEVNTVEMHKKRGFVIKDKQIPARATSGGYLFYIKSSGDTLTGLLIPFY
jgi:hypothetical protein